MPATEPIQGGPYPEPSDAPDGPNQMAAITVWAAGRLNMRFSSEAARDAAITSPVEDMIAVTGTGATQVVWLRTATGWRDITVPGAWVAYTPTTNLTLGNGTLTGRWTQIGKTVHAHALLTFGSTTTVTGGYIGLPVAPSGYAASSLIAAVGFFDASTGALIAGGGFYAGGTDVYCTTSAGVAIAPTAPWTWTTGDKVTVLATYEVA